MKYCMITSFDSDPNIVPQALITLVERITKFLDQNNIIISLFIDLKKAMIWFKSNKLSLNTQKTFYMVFHRARLKTIGNSSMDIIMDNQVLTKVNSTKYLGIIVDHKLNWIDHITYVKAKISKGIGIMYKARKYLNKNTLKNLYHAYIYPYLTYCVEAWGCASKCHLNSLFLLQKKILRIMTFSPYLCTYRPLIQKPCDTAYGQNSY